MSILPIFFSIGLFSILPAATQPHIYAFGLNSEIDNILAVNLIGVGHILIRSLCGWNGNCSHTFTISSLRIFEWQQLCWTWFCFYPNTHQNGKFIKCRLQVDCMPYEQQNKTCKKKLVFYYGIFIYSRLFATAIIIQLECILIHLLFIQPSRVGIAQFVCAFFFYSLPLCFSLLCAFWPLSQCERPKLIHFPHSYHCAIMHYVGLCVFLRPEREGSARGLVVSSLPPIAAMHSQSHQRWAAVLLFGRWIGT